MAVIYPEYKGKCDLCGRAWKNSYSDSNGWRICKECASQTKKIGVVLLRDTGNSESVSDVQPSGLV